MEPPAAGPLRGRVSVVTGGTSGIGREIVRSLAALGATVVIVGRGEERADSVARDISDATGRTSVTAVPVRDLALMSETRRVAERLVDQLPRIHILVNNAGAYYRHLEMTAEGHERTFALNVLSPFLLTSLLASRLVESAPARVVNLASSAHRRQTIDLDRLEPSDGFPLGFGRYAASKLEILLLTREFARRLAGTSVSVNAVHPGFVHSGFGRNNGGGTAAAIGLLGVLFGRNVRRGAQTPVFVASDATVERESGRYFVDRLVNAGSPASADMQVARRLFEACQSITGAPDLPSTSSPVRR
jgi:NAD(P)-dependent dehydrogenase (short-subunit alcohol dehydrogenase family)